MDDRSIINGYIANFRRILSNFLKQGVGMQSVIYPFSDGAIIVVALGYNLSSKDEYRSISQSINEALEKTNIFDKSNEITSALGTNIVINRNKVILIKDNDQKQWDNDAASHDVSKIIASIANKKDGGTNQD